MASVSLLIILACGIGMLILVQDHRIDLPVLLGLSLGYAALIWQHFSGVGGAAWIIASGAATGGITATLMVSVSALAHDGATIGPVRMAQPSRQVWRMIGAALLIVILVGAPPIGLGTLLEAAVLLLAGGTVVSLMTDRLQRATAGLVILIFGFHLLYLAMVSRVSILELLVLDSLPICAALVVAGFPEVSSSLPDTDWTQISPDPDFDVKEPLS